MSSGNTLRLHLGAVYQPVAALGSDLIAYWDTNRPDLITTSGGLISSWLDITNGYNAAQATGSAKPVYSATSFGGFPGATFDGTDDNLACTDAALLAALPGGSIGSEIWVVVQQDSLGADTTTRNAVTYGGSSGAGITARLIGRSAPGNINRGRVGTGDGAALQTVAGSSVNLSSRHVLRSQFSPTATTILVDGTDTANVSVVPSTTSIARLRISGNSGGSVSSVWQGVVAVAIVTKPLSAAKAASLQTYLLSRRRL